MNKKAVCCQTLIAAEKNQNRQWRPLGKHKKVPRSTIKAMVRQIGLQQA